jgi:predicted nucleic acid-binding protein
MPVFLDTVGLLALWDQDDQWHLPALTAFEILKSSRAPLVTTSYVLSECGNAVARSEFRLESDLLRAKLESANGLVFPSLDDWRIAWDGYRKRDAGLAGIVDHLSFVVMRPLNLMEAFTNDRHFTAAGFKVLF